MEQKRESQFVTHLKDPAKIPMVLLGGLALCIHRVLFSWWLDNRMAKRGKQRFTSEIRESMAFLFSEYGGHLVPNDSEPPPYFDWAKVTLNAGGIFFMFTRDHGIVGVHVAPKDAQNCWLELSAVLTAIVVGDDAEREVELARLPTIAVWLKPEMPRLKDALSERNFEKTKEQVSNICKRRNIQATLRLENEVSERRKHLGLS
jgi:hypothetical protein